MMRSQAIPLKNGEGTGYILDLGKAPLLIITTTHGYLMCGYLNITAANKLGDVAGRVTGVKTFDDMLHASVAEISDRAREKGLREGMSGREFLNALL
ncbi:MAG TPA: DUF1805 domain-containing protein [Candidatus Thermoplasmatota archaeon]|nr:DUF1805 domain-containing protein [Candidatus Thermoplasmatota archaeon]